MTDSTDERIEEIIELFMEADYDFAYDGPNAIYIDDLNDKDSIREWLRDILTRVYVTVVVV